MVETNLLIIDENSDFNTLIKFLIESNINWQVSTALDSKEALIKAKSKQPKVILLDIAMPSLTGLEIYRSLKSNPVTCAIPIVFLTDIVKIDKLIKLRIAEDVEIISKPFNMLALANQLINVCDRYMKKNNRQSRHTS